MKNTIIKPSHVDGLRIASRHVASRHNVLGRLWPSQTKQSRAWAHALCFVSLVTLCALCGGVASAQSGGGLFGQDGKIAAPVPNSAPVSEEEASPEVLQVQEIAASVEKSLGVYIVHENLREQLERVVVDGSQAEVWFLRDLDINPQDAKCDAYRWLLLGRFEKQRGALQVFKDNPSLQTLTLVFYAVQTRVRVSGQGDYIQSRTPVRQLELNLTRGKVQSLDPKALRKALRSSRGACITNGQAVVDHHWYIR